MRTPCLAVLFVALAACPARAQSGARIIVFPADGAIKGPLAKAPAAVTTAVAEAARATGARVDIAAGSSADAMTLAGCGEKDPDCLGKVAATLDADMVLVISVAAADSGVFVDIDIGKRGAGEPVRANWILDGSNLAAIQKAAAREAAGLFSGEKEGGEKPAPPPAETGETAPVLPPADRESPVSAPPEVDRGSRLSRVRAYSWITAGAGVALIATGGLFLVGAGNKQDDIDSSPADSLADFQKLESLEDDAESQAMWGNVLLLSGVAAVGVGATLILVQMRSGADEESVALAPAAFDHGAGVTLTVVGDL